MWKLKNNEVSEEFRRSVVERMANAHEVTTENVEEWWEETAGLIRSCGEKVCGRSSRDDSEKYNILCYISPNHP